MNSRELKKIGKQVRKAIFEFKTTSGAGHLHSCLSCVDIVVSLYRDSKTYFEHQNDILLFSKAHGSPVIYPILADLGYFDKDELNMSNNIGLVIGATQTKVMEDARELSKGMPWLIPGVGTQGGDLETALNISHQNGMGIINVSRDILYAKSGNIEDVIQSAINYTNKIRNIIWNPVNC